MTFVAKQHFDIIKMLGGCSLSKKSCEDFFDKLEKDLAKAKSFLRFILSAEHIRDIIYYSN